MAAFTIAAAFTTATAALAFTSSSSFWADEPVHSTHSSAQNGESGECATVAAAAATVDGRRVLVWQPEVTPAPVLLLFHGYGSSPEKIVAASGLPEAAAARGWLVVVPEGSRRPARWALPGRLDGDDDIAFVQSLVADLATTGCADRSRVAAAGFSNGAAFASLLACHMPLRAVALVGGAGLGEPCTRDAPAPRIALLVHGDRDGVVRIDGGPVLGGLLRAAPFADAVDEWRSRGGDVRAVTVENWGHTWPADTTEAVLATFQP